MIAPSESGGVSLVRGQELGEYRSEPADVTASLTVLSRRS